MSATQDKVKGSYDTAVGKVKETTGHALKNKKLEAEGLAQKNHGKGQQILGKFKEKVQEGSHILGDGMEKLGRKLQEKGYSKAGVKVGNVGDKIEHMTDEQDT